VTTPADLVEALAARRGQAADQIGARGARDLGDQLGGPRVARIDMNTATGGRASRSSLSASVAMQSNRLKSVGRQRRGHHASAGAS